MDTTFLSKSCSAENLLIVDTDVTRRSANGAAVAAKLVEDGWTVFAFTGQNSEAYSGKINGFRLRKHVPLDMNDVQEVIESSKVHGERIAVVIDGLLIPGGKPMNRLLKQTNIMVLSISSVRSVRGDHRYSRVWSVGKGWTVRHEPKDFAVVENIEPPAQSGWFSWLKLW